MLPQGHSGGWGDEPESARFGNFAMEKLINELIKAGCSRDRMEIKVFGGGNVIDASTRRSARRTPNSSCATSKPRDCGAPPQDLGDRYPRRIHYYPATGRVVRRLLGNQRNLRDRREEREYADRLSSTQAAGGRDPAVWRHG